MPKQISFTSSNPKLTVHGGGSAFGERGVVGVAGGGRASVDYNLPDGGMLSAGVSGSASAVRSGGKSYKNAQINALDLTYSKGKTIVSGSFEPRDGRATVRLTKRF